MWFHRFCVLLTVFLIFDWRDTYFNHPNCFWFCVILLAGYWTWCVVNLPRLRIWWREGGRRAFLHGLLWGNLPQIWSFLKEWRQSRRTQLDMEKRALRGRSDWERRAAANNAFVSHQEQRLEREARERQEGRGS